MRCRLCILLEIVIASALAGVRKLWDNWYHGIYHDQAFFLDFELGPFSNKSGAMLEEMYKHKDSMGQNLYVLVAAEYSWWNLGVHRYEKAATVSSELIAAWGLHNFSLLSMLHLPVGSEHLRTLKISDISGYADAWQAFADACKHAVRRRMKEAAVSLRMFRASACSPLHMWNYAKYVLFTWFQSGVLKPSPNFGPGRIDHVNAYVGLPAIRFVESSMLPRLTFALEQIIYPVLKAELDRFEAGDPMLLWRHVGEDGGRAMDKELVLTGAWDEIVFFNSGIVNKNSCSLFSETCALIEKHLPQAVYDYHGTVGLSRLWPQTLTTTHRGTTNGRLTAHLLLSETDASTWLEVEHERRQPGWRSGRVTFFDDSFWHSVGHLGRLVFGGSGKPRIILLIRFWHPLLRLPEWSAAFHYHPPPNAEVNLESWKSVLSGVDAYTRSDVALKQWSVDYAMWNKAVASGAKEAPPWCTPIPQLVRTMKHSETLNESRFQYAALRRMQNIRRCFDARDLDDWMSS